MLLGDVCRDDAPGTVCLSGLFCLGEAGVWGGKGGAISCVFLQWRIVVLLMPVSWAQRVVLLPASVASRRSTSCFFSSVYAMFFLFSVKLGGLKGWGMAMFVSFLRVCVVVSRERWNL